MTTFRLILRTLRHYRAINLALVLGIALATAVLTGSLLVGDSIRASLRDIALARLGNYSHAMITTSLFEDKLAERMNADPEFKKEYQEAVPFLQLRGRAVTEDGKFSVNSVQITAKGGAENRLRSGHADAGDNVVDPLGLRDGSSFVLSLPTISDIPRNATLARRSRTDVLAALRVSLDATARTSSFERDFTLAPSQRSPRNVWVAMKDLQQAVNQPGRANLLLVAGNPDMPPNALLKKHLSLADYGVTVSPVAKEPQQLAVGSRATFLRSNVEYAVKRLDAKAQFFSTYLLNDVELRPSEVQKDSARAPTALHYVIATGTNAEFDGVAIGQNEIAINQWTAEQLHAAVGDTITFKFSKRQPNGNLADAASPTAFRIARIIPMEGLGADPSLTPEYPGFTDTDSIADWSPPEGFPFKRSLVTPADEAYWKAHRAAPKIFFNLETARTLWGTPLGAITSARVHLAADKPTADAWKSALLAGLNPADFGFFFLPIRAQQLAAASGSTDFSGLFIGFSFFLILSALILLSLLFRLSVEQRLPQLGLLAAVGYSPKCLRNLLLFEGVFLALIGTILGTAGAVAYTALMIKLLTTLWLPAVGTTSLHLHAAPESLVSGAVISLVLSMVTLLLAIRRYAKENPIALLSNQPSQAGVSKKKSGRRWSIAWWPLIIVLLVAAVSTLAAGVTRSLALDVSCMLAGLLILVAALLIVRMYLRRPLKLETQSLNFRRLAMRNSRIRPTRSLLVIALIACASFILILVGSMKQGAPDNPAKIPSGTGGFRLILTADIPLLGDLGTRDGRNLLALKSSDNPLFARAKFTNLHVWQGQDISCLNMTKPTQPTIAGVDPELFKRFNLTVSGLPKGNWLDGEPLTVVADQNTAEYILHLGPGDTLPIVDQSGTKQSLRLAKFSLKDSIFQSELLMAEDEFQKLFPLQTGFSIVLIECPEEDALPLQRLLESELDEFSVTVEPTAARLARFKEVENTYLATFQTLGGLGLLLGTVGLAIILLRSTLERRPELALLLALGFTRGRIAGLILLENVLLLTAGLGIGTLTALIAVAPAARTLNLAALALSFVLIFCTGLVALLVALRLASRHLTAAAIRAD